MDLILEGIDLCENKNRFLLDRFEVLFKYFEGDVTYIDDFNYKFKGDCSKKKIQYCLEGLICVCCKESLLIQNAYAKRSCHKCGAVSNYVPRQLYTVQTWSHYNIKYYKHDKRKHFCKKLANKDIPQDVCLKITNFFMIHASKIHRIYILHDHYNINYNFVIHMMCIHLGFKKFAPKFKLIKSKKRLKLHAKVWEELMEHLDPNDHYPLG